MTMHKLREYMELVAGNHEKEKEIHEILGCALMKLKAHDEHDFVHMMLKVHCVAVGPHFDEYMAKKAVAAMHNVDGTHGEHWSFEETSNLANQHGVKKLGDWYYALNSLHSDLSHIYGNDVNVYAKIAKALYFDDPDMPDGKLFKSYIGMTSPNC